ncbi:hypothetical protein MTR67_040057 [Solanum verrucosum]|uniref:Uncharacterized protein n=1 Tax=Solanum verrucosum TaxID=315347 RepID=A0AAF0UIB0_SOLVR|nr:hypothetical protein MTR67_040057 [Solanum verrucosum]
MPSYFNPKRPNSNSFSSLSRERAADPLGRFHFPAKITTSSIFVQQAPEKPRAACSPPLLETPSPSSSLKMEASEDQVSSSSPLLRREQPRATSETLLLSFASTREANSRWQIGPTTIINLSAALTSKP